MTDSRDDPKVTPLGDRHDPKLSALYRMTPRDEPPGALDDRILAAARAAAETPERQTRPRWLPVAGGLAASLLVAVLVVQLLPQSQEPAVVASKEESVKAPASQRALEQGQLNSRALNDAVVPSPPAPAAKRSTSAGAPALRSADEPRRETTAPGRIDRPRAPQRMENDAEERAAVGGAASPMEADPIQMPTARDEAFQEIVRLWKAGEKDAATERYRAFRDRYPEFTPRAHDRALVEELDRFGGRTAVSP